MYMFTQRNIFKISQAKAVWDILKQTPPPEKRAPSNRATSHAVAFPKNLMKNVIHKKMSQKQWVDEMDEGANWNETTGRTSSANLNGPGYNGHNVRMD